MSHALIVDDNLIVSRFLEDRLVPLGFDSFEHVWTEDQAVAAAAERSPDLVVVGDSVEEGSPQRAAERISRRCDAPILRVTAVSARSREPLPPGTVTEGPCSIQDIEEAVARAQGTDPATRKAPKEGRPPGGR